MMIGTPAMPPIPGVPSAELIAKYARRGVGGLGQDRAWDDPSAWAVGPTDGQLPSYGPGSGSGSLWERILAPVVPGTMNILTSVLTPPAYQTTSTPSGSQTTVRYPNVPSTIPGYSSTAIVPGTGITNTTIMIIAAAIVGLVLMSRGR